MRTCAATLAAAIAALIWYQSCGPTSGAVSRLPDRAAEPTGAQPASELAPPSAATLTGVDVSREAPPAKARSVTLLAAGDINLGRDMGQRLLREPHYDPFRGLGPLLGRADLRFANLESPLSEQNGETRHPTKHLTFTGPPEGAVALARADFSLLSMANNHAWDYGFDGFLETLDHLERVGVAVAGASRRPGHQYEPRVLHIEGSSVAFFAVTDVWNRGPLDEHRGAAHVAAADFASLAAPLRRARANHDLVIVSYHGGKEYSEFVAREPERFARRVMDAGADAFIGHHPHVPQGIAWHEGKPIFFSLGNLAFERNQHHPWTGRGFIALVQFSEQAAPVVRMCPYEIERGEPKPVSNSAPDWQLRHYRRHLIKLNSYAGFTRVGAPRADGCMGTEPHTPEALSDSFGDPQNAAGLNSAATEMEPALSSDGAELFCTSDRNGSLEIWRATRSCP